MNGHWRTVLALCATAAGFAVSFVLLARVIGRDSPWLALLLMFYFLGLCKVAEPVFTLPLPGSLRAVRPWEISGKLYRRLGVLRYGWLLRNTPLRYLNTSVYRSPASGDLSRLGKQAEAAEAAHFWAMLLFAPYVGFLCLTGHAGMAATFLLFQLLVNAYPILHLRNVRGRLRVIQERGKR